MEYIYIYRWKHTCVVQFRYRQPNSYPKAKPIQWRQKKLQPSRRRSRRLQILALLAHLPYNIYKAITTISTKKIKKKKKENSKQKSNQYHGDVDVQTEMAKYNAYHTAHIYFNDTFIPYKMVIAENVTTLVRSFDEMCILYKYSERIQ